MDPSTLGGQPDNPTAGPRSGSPIPPESWNDLAIRAGGTRIQVWPNGKRITVYDGAGLLDDEAHARRQVERGGHIALQLHAKSRLKMQFRNIEVDGLK